MSFVTGIGRRRVHFSILLVAEGNLSELWTVEQTFPPAAALVRARQRCASGRPKCQTEQERAPEPRRLLRVSHLRGRGTEPVDGPHTHTHTLAREIDSKK